MRDKTLTDITEYLIQYGVKAVTLINHYLEWLVSNQNTSAPTVSLLLFYSLDKCVKPICLPEYRGIYRQHIYAYEGRIRFYILKIVYKLGLFTIGVLLWE